MFGATAETMSDDLFIVSSEALSIQPKILEILVRNQMEQTVSVRSDQNIWDHLWKFSTLTSLLI